MTSFHRPIPYSKSVYVHSQNCKDLMKDLIKKEYFTYYGPDGRSDTGADGAEKFMSERKIFPFFPLNPFGKFAPHKIDCEYCELFLYDINGTGNYFEMSDNLFRLR